MSPHHPQERDIVERLRDLDVGTGQADRLLDEAADYIELLRNHIRLTPPAQPSPREEIAGDDGGPSKPLEGASNIGGQADRWSDTVARPASISPREVADLGAVIHNAMPERAANLLSVTDFESIANAVRASLSPASEAREALEKALRDSVICVSTNHPASGMCLICRTQWQDGIERHQPDCILSPAQKGEGRDD